MISKDGENKAPQHDASEELEVSCTNIITLHEHSDQMRCEVEEISKSVKSHIDKQPNDTHAATTSFIPLEPTLLDVLKAIQQCQDSIGNLTGQVQ